MHTMSESNGHLVLTVGDGVTLGSEADAVDLIGHAFGEQADVVVVPADRVDERFYELRTRVAGDVVRKFAAYHIRLVILGDLGERLAASDSFRAFVHETNKGRDIWFLADHAELDQRLRASGETLGRSR